MYSVFPETLNSSVKYTLAFPHSHKNLIQKLIKCNPKTQLYDPLVLKASSQVSCRSVLSIKNEFEKFSTGLHSVAFVNRFSNSVYTSQILELLSPTFLLNIDQLIMSPNASSTLFKAA